MSNSKKRPQDSTAIGNRSSQQPRIHHASAPEEASAVVAADAPVVAAAASASLNIIDRLHRDTFGVIFSYLRLKDFSTAVQLDHAWKTAVESLKSQRRSLYSNNALLSNLAESTLRHHVTKLDLDPNFDNKNEAEQSLMLYVVRDKLPHLESLDVLLYPFELPFTLMSTKLKHLSITCHSDADPPTATRAWIKTLMDRIGSISSLESLEWNDDIDTVMEDNVDLEWEGIKREEMEGLLQLKHLRKLTWKGSLAPAAIQSIGTIDTLEELNFLDWRVVEDELVLLGKERTTPSPIKTMDLSSTCITDNIAKALVNFPNLTQLHPVRIDCKSAAFLTRLSNLTQLSFSNQLSPRFGSPEDIVASIGGCVGLKILTFSRVILNAVEMGQLLSGLKCLVQLSITNNKRLDSLAFLRTTLHLKSTLNELHIGACPQVPIVEYKYLGALSALKRLSLCGQAFDGCTLARMNPDDVEVDRKTWPQLVHFFHQG